MSKQINDITTNTLKLFKEKVITLPYFDGINYLNNIKSFQIKVNDSTECDLARYIVFSNTILISPNKINEEVLLHELIHMSTSDRTQIDKMSYKMGYEMVTPKNKDITALNEGLTQLIVCNTIDGSDINNDIYPIETRIARMLTYIFGEQEIYKYYFKAQPEEFIRNIISKTNDNSIVTCIVKMDELLALLKTDMVRDFNDDCKLLLYDIQKKVVDMFFKMRFENNLDYETFSKLLITSKVDNVNLKRIINDYDYKIEEYLADGNDEFYEGHLTKNI